MSGSVGSAFLTPNELLTARSLRYQPQAYEDVHQNALMQNQVHQQALATGDVEMEARAASYLMTLPEEQRATAYPGVVADLQGRGFAKHAPSQYPGHDAVARLAAMGLSAKDQAIYGQTQGALGLVDAALGGAPNGAGGQQSSAPPAVSGGSDATIGQRQNNPGNLTFAGQPGASPGQGNRFAAFPDMPSGVAANANQLALYQTQHGINTVRGAVTRWVSDPKANLTSYTDDIAKALGVGADDPIDLTDPTVQAKFIQAQFPHESAGGGYVLNPADVQKGVQMAAAQRGQRVQVASGVAPAPAGAPPQQQASAAPQTPPGGDAPPAPVQVAGPGAPTGGAAPPPPPADASGQPPPGMTVAGERGDQSAQPPAPANLLPNGLTPQQDALIRARRASARTGADVQSILSDISSMQSTNRTMNLQAWQAAHPSIRATPVAGMDAEGHVGTWMVQGDKRVGFIPSPVRPANAPWELQKSDYERDAKDLPELSASAQMAQANQVRIQKMRELVDQVSTGAGGNWRAQWANVAQTAGFADLARKLIGNDPSITDSTAAAQEFAKLGLMAAGTQERGDLGARGSLGAIQLYKSANPGLDLRPDANKRILAMQLVSEQAKSDYSTQALAFANQAGDQFERGGSYTKLSHFDSEWVANRNPQVYAAAMAALSGDSWDKWTGALNMKSQADVGRVLDILRHADPTARVLWKDGSQVAIGQPQ